MNTGLDLERELREQDGTEWVFGSQKLICHFLIPEAEREAYLPVGELQNIGEEKSGCVTRGFVNILETKFTYALKNNLLEPENKKWLEDNGYIENGRVVFADANIEILSGTTRQGNSMKAPVDAIRKHGLVPKKLLPQLHTFDDHYNPARITDEIKKLGEEFLRRFKINYEIVFTDDLENILTQDMVAIAVYAWPTPVDGEYKRSSLPQNHCVAAFSNPLTIIFDNYLDNHVQGDFIKKLAADYDVFSHGYRVFVSDQVVPSPLEDLPAWQKVPLFTWLAQMIAWLFIKKGPMPEIPKEILPEKPVEKPTVPKEAKFSWLTPEEVRMSIRKIGDEYGMSVIEKDLLCDIARCESSFKPNATLQNSPKSIDRGLFQWNSYWHPQITDEIAYDPEKNTRLACQALLDGKAKVYWSASMKCWNKDGKYNSII